MCRDIFSKSTVIRKEYSRKTVFTIEQQGDVVPLNARLHDTITGHRFCNIKKPFCKRKKKTISTNELVEPGSDL